MRGKYSSKVSASPITLPLYAAIIVYLPREVIFILLSKLQVLPPHHSYFRNLKHLNNQRKEKLKETS